MAWHPTRGGDLVLPHAIGVHGLVLLAVPAVLLSRIGDAAAKGLGVRKNRRGVDR